LIQRLRSTLAVIDLRAGAKRIKQAAAGAMRWVHTVTTWLKNISSALWAILANLMTPTQWSFSGNVGTAMFGLANLEIEVTFGDGNRPSSAKTA
ncbi:hypothetical protein MXD81_19130, partial [Microbacteriaceae bacterium K1510]|nr:hypothetical protein [Microbacteriaceae bacterium K1510]